jgi:hypothetical protein
MSTTSEPSLLYVVAALALYGCAFLLMPSEDYLKRVKTQRKQTRWEIPDLPDVTPPPLVTFVGSGNNRQYFDPARLLTTTR